MIGFENTKEEFYIFVHTRALVGSQISDNIREPYWGLRVDHYNHQWTTNKTLQLKQEIVKNEILYKISE